MTDIFVCPRCGCRRLVRVNKPDGFIGNEVLRISRSDGKDEVTANEGNNIDRFSSVFPSRDTMYYACMECETIWPTLDDLAEDGGLIRFYC